MSVLLLAGAVLAASTAAPAPTAREALLEVTATGSVRRVPDRATLTVSVSADAPSGPDAVEANARAAGRLQSAARRAVPVAVLKTGSVTLRPRYRKDGDGDDTDEVTGYRATNRFTALVPAPEAGRMFDALAAAGAGEVDGPDFSFADETPLRRAARVEAVRAAGVQASDYAAALGKRVGRVLRVSERSTRADAGQDIVVSGARRNGTPIHPDEQEVTATVWIDYALTD